MNQRGTSTEVTISANFEAGFTTKYKFRLARSLLSTLVRQFIHAFCQESRAVKKTWASVWPATTGIAIWGARVAYRPRKPYGRVCTKLPQEPAVLSNVKPTTVTRREVEWQRDIGCEQTPRSDDASSVRHVASREVPHHGLSHAVPCNSARYCFPLQRSPSYENDVLRSRVNARNASTASYPSRGRSSLINVSRLLSITLAPCPTRIHRLSACPRQRRPPLFPAPGPALLRPEGRTPRARRERSRDPVGRHPRARTCTAAHSEKPPTNARVRTQPL